MKYSFIILHGCIWIQLISTIVTTACACKGYFCDKKLDSIVVVQTHNSLAVPGTVFSPNQNFDILHQFRDGIRSFNFDLYSRNNSLWTFHGGSNWGYNPSDIISKLVGELENPINRHEFIIVQLQDHMNGATVPKFLQLFGSIVITDFDTSKQLSHYIDMNERVFIATSNTQNVDKSKGLLWVLY